MLWRGQMTQAVDGFLVTGLGWVKEDEGCGRGKTHPFFLFVFEVGAQTAREERGTRKGNGKSKGKGKSKSERENKGFTTERTESHRGHREDYSGGNGGGAVEREVWAYGILMRGLCLPDVRAVGFVHRLKM